MIDYIKKSLYLHKGELLFFPLLSVGMFAFGHLILWLVMTFDKSSDLTSFEMGTVMALMGLLFVGLFSSLGYTSSFNYALSMSQKRGRIITGLTAVAIVRAVSSIIVIYFLNIIERYVCKTIFSEFPMESDLSVIFKPHIMLTIALAFVAFESLFGALYTKFGTKNFWIVWIVFVLLMQIPGRIADQIADDKNHIVRRIFEFLTSCDETILFGILIAIMIAIISLPYVLLRKQQVTM